MKNFIVNTLRKTFSKTVQIPPKFQNQDLKRVQKGVYKFENYIDNTREDSLHKEKVHYNNIIEICSKRMIYNHFNMNQKDNNKVLFDFYNFIAFNLDINQINKGIKIIDEIKVKLNSKKIGKTENLFKYLLSKLYYLTNDTSNKD